MNKLLSFISVILIFNLKAFAQCPSPKDFGFQWVLGDFKVLGNNSATQCTGRPMVVVTASKVTNARYVYDYKVKADTAKATTATTYTYSTPGYYYIVQIGTVGGKPSITCGLFLVLATPKPTFSLSSCEGSTVKLNINTTNLDFDQYIVDWGDGKPAQSFSKTQNTPAYTYAAVGTYSIKVTGSVNGGDCKGVSDPQTFIATTPATAMPTFLTSEVKSDASAELVFKSSQVNQLPQLNQRISPATASTVVPSLAAVANGTDWKYVINGLQAEQQMYCYTFRQSKQCGGVTTNVASNEICTMPFSISAQPYQNVLSWKVYPSTSFKQYLVKRDGVLIANISANTTTSFTDTKVVCGKVYQYQIFAETSEITSSSILKSIKTEPSAELTSLSSVNVSVLNNKSQIKFLNPPLEATKLKNYQIETKSKVYYTTQTTYVDSVSMPDLGQLCYKINYTDICDRSPRQAIDICTIFLREQDEKLTWSSNSPFSTIVKTYTVEKINEQGVVLKSYSVDLNKEWEIDQNETDQELRYRVKAMDANGNLGYSNVVFISRVTKISVPDAFTPNGDFFNDVFEVKSQFITLNLLMIYDRWGKMIFISNTPRTGWNGYDLNGKLMPTGVYSYQIDAIDNKNKSFTKTGMVYLLR